DHGFQSVTRTVHMDHLLKRFGYLEFSASNALFGPMQWGPVRKIARKAYDMLGLHGKVSLPQSVNWSKTRAYTTIRSTGEGVSINLAGREPDGVVDSGDFERVRDEVMDRLASFVDTKTGKKPVKAIYKREEVFKGKYADTAPDILMEPEVGYSLTHARTALEDADWISGDHRPEGTIVAVGPNVRPFDHDPNLIDMAPTILAALDAPASIKHTGRVLHEVVGSADVKQRADAIGQPAVDENAVAASAIPGMGGGDPSTVSDTEADEMEEHLRGLGYLE
ncbi:MAG TPA: alkaline phosphatase family protein, partial [Actinomycetota bacterium]|nr:alkaline phosphatase family protein [Actinomycetota bacterium]